MLYGGKRLAGRRKVKSAKLRPVVMRKDTNPTFSNRLLRAKRGSRGILLERFTIEMSLCHVGEDKAGEEGEAENPVGLAMQPDEASRCRRQSQRYRMVLRALAAATRRLGPLGVGAGPGVHEDHPIELDRHLALP